MWEAVSVEPGLEVDYVGSTTSFKGARPGWTARHFFHGPWMLMINLCDLIRVIVFMVAMTITIIDKSIRKCGDQ